MAIGSIAGQTVLGTHQRLMQAQADDIEFAPVGLKWKTLRPFLTTGDFVPGGWGHSLVDELQPADLVVEKVAYSAFYQTRMEFVLSRAGIRTLMVCGIVTNGGVASTVRDAHVRDFNTITLHDGCAAFSPETHDTAIKALATVGKTMSIAEAQALFSGS